MMIERIKLCASFSVVYLVKDHNDIVVDIEVSKAQSFSLYYSDTETTFFFAD